MIDDEVQELVLIRREPAACEEFSEGSLGSLPVKTYQGADKTREPAISLESSERCFINSSLKKNTLQLLQIGRCQRLVPAQLEHGYVVLVRLKKHPCLAAERVHVGTDRNARHRDVGSRARCVFEIRIDQRPL